MDSEETWSTRAYVKHEFIRFLLRIPDLETVIFVDSSQLRESAKNEIWHDISKNYEWIILFKVQIQIRPISGGYKTNCSAWRRYVLYRVPLQLGYFSIGLLV